MYQGPKNDDFCLCSSSKRHQEGEQKAKAEVGSLNWRDRSRGGESAVAHHILPRTYLLLALFSFQPT